MSKDRSVDSFVRSLRAGDPGATKEVFDLYVDRLVGMARKRISLRLAGRIDAEDIVQSVFRTFFHRAKQGQFQITAEDDICRMLARITVHKTLRQVAHHQAGKRDAGRDAGSGDDSQDLVVNLLSKEPSPDEATALLDHLEHFLAQLKPDDRKILELRMQGYTTLEIAEQLKITDRKIRRLMERVRTLATREELLPAEDEE
ncbi:MAG: sigma-70 family RNA polymerase sigma factor [Planctomycetota bacterium]|jgi:RNA polymerase sigma-70 factor (ECF subfamily)